MLTHAFKLKCEIEETIWPTVQMANAQPQRKTCNMDTPWLENEALLHASVIPYTLRASCIIKWNREAMWHGEVGARALWSAQTLD